MTKLLMVTGSSGSGKSTVAKVAEQEFGVSRYGIDDYAKLILPSPKYSIRFALDLLDEETKEVFWSNPERTYDWQEAARIVAGYEDQLKTGKVNFQHDDKLFAGSAVLRKYLTDMMNSFSSGNNIVIEGGPGASRAFAYVPCENKYVLKLRVHPETAIQRKMDQRGWDREKAAETIKRTSWEYKPKFAVTGIWERDNETESDMAVIRSDFRELFGE